MLTRKRSQLTVADRAHIFPGGRSTPKSDGMDIHFCLIAFSWREFKFIQIFIEALNIYNYFVNRAIEVG